MVKEKNKKSLAPTNGKKVSVEHPEKKNSEKNEAWEFLGEPLTENEALKYYNEIPPMSDEEIEYLISASKAYQEALEYFYKEISGLSDSERKEIFGTFDYKDF